MLKETAFHDTLSSRVEDDAWYSDWRARELSRLDASGMSYVDYTGAALAPESLLRSDFERLSTTVLGNPHSEHRASRASTADLNAARDGVLQWLHASPEEYAVVFTANASAACRLVGEAFPFRQGSVFCLAADNHNSVNGIREFARARNARVQSLELDDELRLVRDEMDVRTFAAPSLYAFPAQSNFSGVRHPLSLVKQAQSRGYRVLLDAASFLPTETLRLDAVHPDFVVFSLYKIIGYPWGVGVLVMRRDAMAELERPWFAGGTVDWVSIAHGSHQLHGGTDAFEDGTPAFMAAGGVSRALAAFRAIEPERLGRHTRSLTDHLLHTLDDLRHDNGLPVVEVYGPRSMHQRGSTIALNVHDVDGVVVPYWEVERDALQVNLALRGGCFCNPGCAERAFRFPGDETRRCLQTLGTNFSVPKFSACLNRGAVGAIRISFGLGSVCKDVQRVSSFLARYKNLTAGRIEPAMPTF